MADTMGLSVRNWAMYPWELATIRPTTKYAMDSVELMNLRIRMPSLG